MIPRRAAWTLSRTLAGIELNGELEAIPEPYRTMAARLNERPATDRVAAFEDMLAAWLDRDELVKALADEDPAGPPPEDHGDSVDEWEPIRLGTLPPVELFPLDVLPYPAREMATAAAILAAASGLIGRSASLFIKSGYSESACLFMALVGKPSSGKTPGLDAAMAPVWSINEMLYRTWQAERDARKQAGDDEADEPILRRIVTTDPTTEALGPILAKNPRGLIVSPDEFTKWLMSMDQYKGGKGGDRPFYLSAWSGKPVCIDRAKHMREPIMVPVPFLTVVGGLTPGMLTELRERKGRDDGFTARQLFVFPDWTIPPYSVEGIPDDVANGWDRMARSLWDREMTQKDGKPVPRVVRMTPAAAAAWARWCNAHRAEQWADDFPDSLEGPWGKLETYAARLALILHLLHLASDPTRSPPADPPKLSHRIIEAASRLVAYFKSHARRVYAAIDGKLTDGGDNVTALVRWILRNDLDRFSTRDIDRNFHRYRDDPAVLAHALGWMTSHNLIRPTPDPEAPRPGKPGRKRASSYDVNPLLKTAPRFRQFRRNPPARPGFVGNVGNAAPLEQEKPRVDRLDWPAIKDRIDLAAVATTLLGPAARRQGRRLLWRCPFHDDHDPSFIVDPDRRTWRCYPCGIHGDAGELVKRIHNVGFPEAAAIAAELSGIVAPSGTITRPAPRPRPPATAPASKPTKAASKPPERPSGLPLEEASSLVTEAADRLWKPEGRQALAYLHGRCLTDETIRAARLGWTPGVMVPREGATPFKARGVVIPWFDRDRLALVKIRQPEGTKPKYAEAFRDRPALYPGPEAIRQGRPLIITEGEFDRLLLAQELRRAPGLPGWAAVVTLGSSSARPDPDTRVRMLAAPDWFVAHDADSAGDRAASQWPSRVQRVRPPAPFNDWTEAAQAGVNLRCWWLPRLGGTEALWNELARWRWGPALIEHAPDCRRPQGEPCTCNPDVRFARDPLVN